MSTFRFNHIVIVQSLENHESQTGDFFKGFVEAELCNAKIDLVKVVLVKCESAPDFLELIKELEAAGSLGMRPIVHIECHGDMSTGLEFANGSELAWRELSQALARVNLATDFNLIAIVSACFGAYFASQMSPLLPAPCYALISPSLEINPYEIKLSLEDFYRDFLQNASVEKAVGDLRKRKLEKGIWFAVAAEDWFARSLLQFVREGCTNEACIERAHELNAQMKAVGKPEKTTEEWLGQMRSRQRNLVQDAFEMFFSLQRLPHNARRFERAYSTTKRKFEAMRATGTYVI